MAIEKSFFPTQPNLGIIDRAYYKVHDVIPLTDNMYLANVWVCINEYERQNNPDIPFAQNRMKFEIDPSAFIEGISENENQIKQSYNKLKNLTDSFKNDSTDV